MQSGGLKINNDDGIRSQLRLPEILIIRNHFLNVMAVIYRVRKWAQFIKLTLIARRKQSGTKIDKCLTTPVKTGNSVVLTFLGTIWQNYLEAWNLKNPIRQRHLNLPFPSRMLIQRPPIDSDIQRTNVLISCSENTVLQIPLPRKQWTSNNVNPSLKISYKPFLCLCWLASCHLYSLAFQALQQEAGWSGI